ncbi:MAG: YmdB family metallophosphoesterase [Phycisphaerae bacterium]|nr:YmdB family metallophosphoesterase [Phycisphaerae bacterium]
MALNVLCIGDVVGRPGRYVISQGLEQLIKDRDLGCVICNAENAAGGSGLTPQLFEKFLRYGVDIVTLGDHVYKKRDLIPVLSQTDRIVRPANLPPTAPGRDYVIRETPNGHRVAMITLLGRLYMRVPVDCPFRTVDAILAKLPADVKVIVVEMHAEATSEKIALGRYLDGRVSLVFGTHTHVPTADECILPKGTAYITDLGMTGPHDSVLGRRTDRVLQALTTSVPCPFDVAVGEPRMNGVIVGIDPATGRAQHIERIRMDGTPPPDGVEPEA